MWSRANTWVTQAGTPDLGYNDVIKGGKILQEIKPILKTTHIKKAKVAIVYSDDAKMYMNVENGGIYRYRPTFTEIYEAITRRGISVEVVRENANFSKFNCVIVPFVRYVSDNLLSKFKKFAQNGGKLILGPMTGDRTIDGNWHRNINGLGKLGEWLGIKNVVQYLSKEDKTATTIDKNGKIDRFEGLVTLFETDHPLSKVKTIAPVTEDRSITFANNNVIYMGGMPQNCMNSIFWDYLVEEIIRLVSDQKIEKMTDGIYQYQRENEDYLICFHS